MPPFQKNIIQQISILNDISACIDQLILGSKPFFKSVLRELSGKNIAIKKKSKHETCKLLLLTLNSVTVLTIRNGLATMNLLYYWDSSDMELAIALQQQEFEQQPPRQSPQKPSISGSSRLVTGPQVKSFPTFTAPSLQFCLSTDNYLPLYAFPLSVGFS